jgi:DNA replication protein DnaC
VAEREVRSITYQTKAARFPAYKDLTGFDFTSSEVNEAMVRQLHRGDFIDGANKLYTWDERVDMSYWISANGQPANR